MKSTGRCFAQSNPLSMATESFEELLDSLCNAFRAAQRRKQEQATAPGHLIDEGGFQQRSQSRPNELFPTGADLGDLDFVLPENMNFEAQDFFEFGGATESANIMQLWPMNHSPLDGGQYFY